MHRGETEKSFGMNMKALHQSLMKQNTAMMPVVSIKNNNFCLYALENGQERFLMKYYQQ